MLLAWDTTDRLNWGARAAHIATHQLLKGVAGQIDVLSGRFQRREEPIDFVLPEWLAEPLRRRRDRHRWAEAYVQVESFFGAKPDYVDLDPQVTRRNILENQNNDRLCRLCRSVRQHDRIVIDGNGDMILKQKPRRTLLMDLALVELAAHFEKEIYYVNSILSDCPVSGRNQELAQTCMQTLGKCDAVAFRDPRSYELADELNAGFEPAFIPDSLFFWHDVLADSEQDIPARGDFVLPYEKEDTERFGRLRFDVPYVCVTGGSRAAFNPDLAADAYARLVEALTALEHEVYLVPTGAGDAFLYEVAEATRTPILPTEVPIMMGGAILANASLFITGRYHPSIMAAAGGTPCVFLGADSHKTSSLQRMLGYGDAETFSATPTSAEREAIVDRAKSLLHRGGALRDKIQQASREKADAAARLRSFVEGA